MSESILLMEHVHKVIKDQKILNDVNLRVTKGQIVALCGGNGAGKSTILRLIAGIIHPTQGEITVGGMRWNEDRFRYAEQIGFMPDDYRFHTGITALEAMVFWAKLRGVGNERAKEVLTEVGLEHALNKSVASFSKGMRQRVMYAQAVLAKPKLLLMDEPTNGLDPYWMESFAALVRKAAAQGQTVLFSTHQLQMAEALADRIVFLRSGVIELEGEAAQVCETLAAAGMRDSFSFHGRLTSEDTSPPESGRSMESQIINMKEDHGIEKKRRIPWILWTVIPLTIILALVIYFGNSFSKTAVLTEPIYWHVMGDKDHMSLRIQPDDQTTQRFRLDMWLPTNTGIPETVEVHAVQQGNDESRIDIPFEYKEGGPDPYGFEGFDKYTFEAAGEYLTEKGQWNVYISVTDPNGQIYLYEHTIVVQ